MPRGGLGIGGSHLGSIEMFADTDAKLSLNEPATIASAASVSQPSGCGVRAASNAAWTMTAVPTTATAARYARSRRTGTTDRSALSVFELLRVGIGQDRRAPEDLVAAGGAPQNLVTALRVDPR